MSCALGLAGAPAEALTVALEVTVTNTLQPQDPIFPDSSLGGTVQFSQGILGDTGTIIFIVPVGDPIVIPPLGPGETYPVDPIIPPNPITPTDPMLVSFTGILGTLLGDFPAFFFPVDPAFDDPFLVGTWEVTVRAVPAPASLALLALGLGSLALLRRRRRRGQAFHS